MLQDGRRCQGIHLLMALAGLCLLAQSSLLAVLGTDASLWNPSHTHISFDGGVPPHRHAYDHHHHAAHDHSHPDEASCMAADNELEASDGAASIVCPPAHDGLAASSTVLLHQNSAGINVAPAGIDSPVAVSDTQQLVSVALKTTTPPPRI
jgi:hypothetical protein